MGLFIHPVHGFEVEEILILIRDLPKPSGFWKPVRFTYLFSVRILKFMQPQNLQAVYS